MDKLLLVAQEVGTLCEGAVDKLLLLAADMVHCKSVLMTAAATCSKRRWHIVSVMDRYVV